MEDLTPHLRSQLDNDKTLEEALAHLHSHGAFPVAVIAAIQRVNKCSPAEAKEVLAASPAWQREVRAGEVLHEQVARMLNEVKK
jgi:hypothetical protein